MNGATSVSAVLRRNGDDGAFNETRWQTMGKVARLYAASPQENLTPWMALIRLSDQETRVVEGHKLPSWQLH